MDFVIEQWNGQDGKLYRQLFIDDQLRFQLTTESPIYGNIEFKLGHDSRPDLYQYSDLEIKNFVFESFADPPTTTTTSTSTTTTTTTEASTEAETKREIIIEQAERIFAAISGEGYEKRFSSRMNKLFERAREAETGENCYEENGFVSDPEADAIQNFDEEDICKLNSQVNAALSSWARNYACKGRGKVYRQIVRKARKVKNFFHERAGCSN